MSHMNGPGKNPPRRTKRLKNVICAQLSFTECLTRLGYEGIRHLYLTMPTHNANNFTVEV